MSDELKLGDITSPTLSKVTFPKYYLWRDCVVKPNELTGLPEVRDAPPASICFVEDGDSPGLYVKGLTKWNLIPGTGQ